jgi:hypothetical protein
MQMTNEERDIITQYIQRVGGAPAAGFGGSVPATTQPLPPIDREADALIADLFNRYPEARYRLTQTAFVQEHALVEAQNQINRLQWELQQARQQAPAQQAASPWGAAAQSAPQQAPPPQGMFGRLFGSSQPQQPQYQQPQQPQYAPPPPQYAPGYQPGMFQRQGSGFLGSALTTAAGVAGGMVAGNALMNLFSGGHGGGFGGGGFGGGGFGGGGGFAGPAAVEYAPTTDPYDTGGAPKDSTWDNSNTGGWQDPNAGSGGWQDVGSADSGTDDSGWTDAGGSDDISNT